MRNINHIQKAQQIPSRVDPKRSIPNTLLYINRELVYLNDSIKWEKQASGKKMKIK